MPAADFIYGDAGVILIKQESTYGVDAVPVGTDAALCKEMSVTPTVDMLELERQGHTFRAPGSTPTLKYVNCSFKFTLAGGFERTDYVSQPPPDWEPLLLCSGYKKTNIQDTDYTAGTKSSKRQVYNLTDGWQIEITTDLGVDTITFNTGDFTNIARATAAEMATHINANNTNSQVVALGYRGYLYLKSPTTTNLATINVSGGTAQLLTEVGFSAGVVAATQLITGYTYSPDSMVAQPSCTIYCYKFIPGSETLDKSYLIKVLGAVFNVKFYIKSEEEACIEFDGNGAYVKPAASTYPTGITYSNTKDAMKALGGNVTFDDYDSSSTFTEVFDSLEVDSAWEVKPRKDMSPLSGIIGYYITRKGTPSGSFNPDVKLPETTQADQFARVENAKGYKIDGTWKSDLGSQCAVSMPNVQFGSPNYSADGLVKFDQSILLRDNSDDGDDWISLTFTSDNSS